METGVGNRPFLSLLASHDIPSAPSLRRRVSHSPLTPHGRGTMSSIHLPLGNQGLKRSGSGPKVTQHASVHPGCEHKSLGPELMLLSTSSPSLCTPIQKHLLPEDVQSWERYRRQSQESRASLSSAGCGGEDELVQETETKKSLPASRTKLTLSP